MKISHICREAEIEAPLHWAELRPRASAMELIEKESTSETQLKAQNLPFDKYPIYLLEQVLQFSKGDVIEIDRDEIGRVKRILGLIDGEIESDSTFIYDEGSTTIHCFCHNCEDDPVSKLERMSFADFHIDHFKESLISYSLDITEFYPECKEIKRYHSYHKIFTNNDGNVIKILQDNKPCYDAEYDDYKKIIRKIHGPITTEYKYSNNQLILKKCSSDKEIIEQITYEYAENEQGPVQVFSNTDSCLRLKALNSYCISISELIHLTLENDGIARYHYDNSGNLVLKIHIPYNIQKLDDDIALTHLKELPGKFETVEMFLVDNTTGDMRIIKKKTRDYVPRSDFDVRKWIDT
jgi:hypothetical protein